MSICSELDYDNLERLESHLKYKIDVDSPDNRILEQVQFIRIIAPAFDDGDGYGDRSRRGRFDKRGSGRSSNGNFGRSSGRTSARTSDKKSPAAHAHGQNRSSHNRYGNRSYDKDSSSQGRPKEREALHQRERAPRQTKERIKEVAHSQVRQHRQQSARNPKQSWDIPSYPAAIGARKTGFWSKLKGLFSKKG